MKRLPQIAVALVALFALAWRRSHQRGTDMNTLGSLRYHPPARPSSAPARLTRRFRLWAFASALGDRRCVGFAYFVVSILYLVSPGPALAQSPLPDAFNPGAGYTVYALAVPADGKILVGGNFGGLGGQQSLNSIGRLNADGTLDTGFNPGADNNVLSLAQQADGKILAAGWFNRLGGQRRAGIGRLNPDGTLDTSFDAGADGLVCSLAVQVDGNVLVGGEFTMLGGQSRHHFGRLNADGTLDTSFNPGANGAVLSLALQADGKILV
jgi:uncharacterized delta-60 repeat protein